MNPLRRRAALIAGIASLAAAFLPPVERPAEELFSGHMVQHLLLVLVASPLLAYGAPSLSVSGLRLPGWISGPVAAGLCHAAVLWAWHLPGPYEAAVRSPALHVLEHLSFLLTALWFWRVVIGGPAGRRTGYLAATVLVVATALQSCALGVIISFAAFPLYRVHAAGAAAWGLSALEDQQLAGVIMWIPAGAVYLATTAVLLLRTFGEMERRIVTAEMVERRAPETGR